jgi:nucleoside-diphosphate-sugar epimerase
VRAGWTVRALHRDPSRLAKCHPQVTWIKGDAMRREDVVTAMGPASLIVHAVNPPGYRNWSRLVLPMLDNTIAAARLGGARIVLPGTVYNYGPDAFPSIGEDASQRPATRKGEIRAEMERRLRLASTQGARVLIVRAGDYFGPTARNNWFSQGLVQPGKTLRTIRVPGPAGVGHQWAYLPDVARTMVALLARRAQLDPFATFHMDGHWDRDGQQFAQAIQRVVAGRTGATPRVAAFPWWLVALASPFNETLRELFDMRYLWRTPVRLDNARLRRELGSEPHTPLEQAIEATLEGLGLLAGVREVPGSQPG